MNQDDLLNQVAIDKYRLAEFTIKIKEQKEKIEKLEEENNKLKQRLNNLENSISGKV
jgi:cell division protein FtsB